MKSISADILFIKHNLKQLIENIAVVTAQIGELSSSPCIFSHKLAVDATLKAKENSDNYAVVVAGNSNSADGTVKMHHGATEKNSSRRPGRRDNQQDAVAAMYIDIKRKQRRANNIVISGLPPSDCEAAAVVKLLQSEFGDDKELWPGVSIARCKRLGKQQENKVQPLLVVLESREQAEYYLKNARYLRSSNNAEVRRNVYINADLTPSEAKAAFELRVKKKQHAQRDQSEPSQHHSAAGRTFYRSHGNAAAAFNQLRVGDASLTDVQSQSITDQSTNVMSQTILLKWRPTAEAVVGNQTASSAASAPHVPHSGASPSESTTETSLIQSFRYNTKATEFHPSTAGGQLVLGADVEADVDIDADAIASPISPSKIPTKSPEGRPGDMQ